MRRLRTINLIAFFALILLVNDNNVLKVYALKNYLRALVTSLTELKNLGYGILPGTRWCGRGNIARPDSEFGVYRELDKCCMTHDLCEDYIRPKAERYGLYNGNICRSSLCECEVRFYDCLKRAGGTYATVVGKLYFAACKQCLRLYYDPETCVREGISAYEGQDRKGRRIFCAKFDRNPKWRRRHGNVTQSVSTTEPAAPESAWNDNGNHDGGDDGDDYYNYDNYDNYYEFVRHPDSRSLPANDDKDYVNGGEDEDGVILGDYTRLPRTIIDD